jgi:hypothetical protein
MRLLRQAKLGEGGRPCKGIAMLETFYATQQVRALTGQGWPPAGIECCVVRGRPRLRSVHRERAGRVMEPREKSMRSRRRYVDGRPHRRS